MPTLAVTSKGQITLKKDILKHMGVHSGSKLEIDMLPDGGIKLTPQAVQGNIADFCGFLKREGQRPISIEEMNEVIAQGWAGDI